MSRRRRRSRIAMAGIAGCLLVASCSVPEDEQAQAIDPVPFDLLETTTSTTSTTVVAAPDEIINLAFFWHTTTDNRLIVWVREVTELPAVQDWLDALVEGPTAEDLELVEDLGTLIDPATQPVIAEQPDENGVHRITINRPAETITSGEAAEIVCTVLQFSGIERVSFQSPEGEPIPFSNFNAEAVLDSAGAEDFNDCNPTPVPDEGPADDGLVTGEEGDSTTTTTTTTTTEPVTSTSTTDVAPSTSALSVSPPTTSGASTSESPTTETTTG